ncbi:RES family NAD+ phosphorylase [Actinocorallia sp. B10E7]|uniref:RES family NAD+ phosphorylase n=1 Tax=Actinocorallia sp. B10E7 TaxID=3153558 RepID=UPI00325E612C
MPPQPLVYRADAVSLTTLPAGTVLWRFHESRFAAESFAPPREDPFFTGYRFDGTRLYPYPYYYAADRADTALAEVLLRQRRFDPGRTERLIGHHEVAGRRLSAVETTADLRLANLVSALDLSRLGQDEWLLEASGAEQIQTRVWAGQLWEAEERVQGMLWMSRRNRPERALLLFGDRCGEDFLKPLPDETLDFDSARGVERANDLLEGFAAAIVPPPSLA